MNALGILHQQQKVKCILAKTRTDGGAKEEEEKREERTRPRPQFTTIRSCDLTEESFAELFTRTPKFCGISKQKMAAGFGILAAYVATVLAIIAAVWFIFPRQEWVQRGEHALMPLVGSE